jgi:hypothetical protein
MKRLIRHAAVLNDDDRRLANKYKLQHQYASGDRKLIVNPLMPAVSAALQFTQNVIFPQKTAIPRQVLN